MSCCDLLRVMRSKYGRTATVMPPNQWLHPTHAASKLMFNAFV